MTPRQSIWTSLVSPVALLTLTSLLLYTGCGSQAEQPQASFSPKRPLREDAEVVSVGSGSRRAPEISGSPASVGLVDEHPIRAADYLAQCLSESELKDGWIRLFDNLTLRGWFQIGSARWRVEDRTITVRGTEPSFLCTSVQYSDFELKVDFKAHDPKTNSGIFLRSSSNPLDPSKDCYELNIAPPDNKFPTGSFVARKKLDPSELGDFDPTNWHTFRVQFVGKEAKVWLDDKLILEHNEASDLRRGFICLQYNTGGVSFREILLRPLNTKPLRLDEKWQDDWTFQEKQADTMKVEPTSDGLVVRGGLGQIETKSTWDDFVLQATYRLANRDVNSGIFFRCIPGNLLDGYECQINHSITDNDVLKPADYGAGGLFRRGKDAEAKIVVGDGTSPTHVTIVAEGAQFATWINGLQMIDFADTRSPDLNPRRGLRREAGSIAIQGHDSTTEITLSELQIGAIEK